MKLFTKPGACSTADHIALAWSGLPFETEIVKDLKSPEYLAINPAGAVPAIQEGDWILTQNAAIMQYISDLAPDAQLAGDGSAKQRAEANRWLSFVNADLHPAFKPMFGAARYVSGDEAQAEIKQNARNSVRGLLEKADAQLKDHDYIAGFRSYADPYLYITLRWAKGMKIDTAGLDALEGYYARMEADSGVQQVLKAEGLA